MPKNSTISQAKYDAEHCIRIGLKLNTTTDAEIIAKLDTVPSKQGYIRQLISDDIQRNGIRQTTKAE